MSKVIATYGPSGSGKSVWAKSVVAGNPKATIVCRDDIRQMLGQPPVGNQDQEKRVTKIQRGMIETALLDGFDPVIVADTNLNKDIRQGLVKYVHKLGYDVEFKVFDEELETCIARDLMRDKPVGEVVIRRQYDKFKAMKDRDFAGLEDAPVRVRDSYSHSSDGRESIYVFDLDQTLADGNNHRSPYDYSKVIDDEPIHDIVQIAKDLAKVRKLVFVSGREDTCRDQTEKWVETWIGPGFELFMRKEGDMREDYEMKNDVYDEHIIPKYNVIAAYDDRPQILVHLRNRGITALQCRPSRF